MSSPQFGRDARTRIGDPQHDVVRLQYHAHGQQAAYVAVLGGVVQQVAREFLKYSKMRLHGLRHGVELEIERFGSDQW